MTFTISISPAARALWPNLFVTGLIATDVDRIDPSAARDALALAGEAARARLSGYEPITAEPALAEWREAYGTAGVKPSRFRASIEALARRAQADTLGSAGPAVDIYNACSLISLAPLGAIDLTKLGSRDVAFRLCRPETDRFEPLGGQASDFPLTPGLPVYATGDTLLCWGFNVRDSREVALDGGSRTVAFMTEGVSPLHMARADDALRLLGERLRAAGARVAGVVETTDRSDR